MASVHNDVILASESAVPAGTSSCAYALRPITDKNYIVELPKVPKSSPSPGDAAG
jgi:hypothetical protein